MTASVNIPAKVLKNLPLKKIYSLEEVFNVYFLVEERNDLLKEKLQKIEKKGGFKKLGNPDEMMAW